MLIPGQQNYEATRERLQVFNNNLLLEIWINNMAWKIKTTELQKLYNLLFTNAELFFGEQEY